MSGIVSILLLGFLLGVKHATDADHVVAVGAMSSREGSVRRALQVGVAWGVGHALTVLLAGGAIVLLGLRVPARLGLGLEFAVAVVLVVLGLLNLSAGASELPAKQAHPTGRSTLGSLGVGLVHGLAGSAAVALLVVGTLTEPSLAVLYLGVFGLGTILGMAMLTTLVALPLAYASQRMQGKALNISSFAGLLSLALGLVLVYRIGFVHGLFSSSPTWNPG